MSNKCNRRRENAQSASSSKAAELLQNSGLSIPFLGIEALNLGGKLSGSDISAIPVDDAYANISPELKIIFKKLTKKDSLTREKAMKELCDYIKPEDELRTIFPYFASNYSKLVTSIPFLLLSLNDKCDQVSKLAEALLLECFPEQKRALMLRTYSNDAMILALEVVKLKHKLVQPQQFVEDETDAQRQARLVAQGLETMEMLVQEDYETCKCMCDDFFQSPAVITSLMNSSAMSVRIATLAFLSNLLQKNPQPCFGTKIPSMILSNLDAENVALCRNAFECFIILAGDKRFYETCNIDKAVVPKLLGVVRKKNMHWTVLETSLLPAFALVTNNLGEMDRGKWTCSLIDSFFEGSLQSISMVSWATPFSELCRYCFANYANDSELITFILTKVLQFIDVILINSKEGLNLLAQVATLVKACLMNKVDDATLNGFSNSLRLNLLNKLPASCRLIEKLVDSSDDHQFCSAIAKDEKLPNATVIKILQKHPEILIQEQHLLAIVAKRVGHENTSHMEMRDLLHILCNYLSSADSKDSLNKYLQTNDLQVGKALMQIPTTSTASLLSQQEKFEITSKVYKDLINLDEEIPEADQRTFICWTLSQLEQESLNSLLMRIAKDNKIKTFTVLLLEDLLSAGKISKAIEKVISLKLFGELMKNSENISESAVLSLMSKLEVDFSVAKSQFQEYLCCPHVDFSRVSNIPIFGFANASITSFLPSTSEFVNLADELDKKFMTRMITNEDSFLLSYFAQCLENFGGEQKLSAEDEFAFIFAKAKKALFAARVLNMQQQKVENLESAECFVWITSVFVAFLQRTAYAHQKDIYCTYLDHATQTDFTGIFNLLSSTDRHTNHIPVSVAFAVSWSLNTQQLNSLKISELLKQFHTHESSLFSTTLSASSFGLNLCSVEEPSSAMMELGLQHENQDLQQTNKDFDEQTIALWIYEFERTLTYKNLELALLTLKLFVERKGAADEWLFMYQEEQLKNALSCALLKVACKVVPFLAEIDSSIRDFVNCGFITALQSCTDSFSNLSTEKNLLSTFSILCLKLHHVYDNCIKLNMDNQDYSDIKQEWREFFGPSSATFILGWFVDLYKDEAYQHHSQFLHFLCQAIHSIDEHMILRVELSGREDGEESTKYFNGYPCNLSALLSRAFPLFFHKQPHIQLASAKIFKSALLDMFLVENSTGVNSNEDGETEDQSLQPQETKHLPTFFADLLAQQVNLDDQEDEKDSQIQACSSSKQDRQPSGPAIDPLLLGWDVIVRFLAELDVLSRVSYCNALDHKLVARAMQTLFSLLPDPPARNGQEVDDLFKEPMNHSNSTAFDATHFVCHLYYKSLIVMPALVRQWYHSLSKNYVSSVNKYTRKHVSHLVLRREIQNVANTKRGRLEVKVMAKVNEVAACYRMEDSQIRLNIALPADYPLSLATIDTERSIVSKELHRKWLLQLEMFLGHQNGSMLEGILQWKRNIDKHLEGIEDCTICMMTVSSTNYQLPKIRCRQCKNKFHGDCLYKWFQTSSNSSCPLCRSSFV